MVGTLLLKCSKFYDGLVEDLVTLNFLTGHVSSHLEHSAAVPPASLPMAGKALS